MNCIDYRELGRRIRQRRKAKSLTQDQVSEMVGVSLSFYGHLERGTRRASVETLKAICHCLELSMDDVAGCPIFSPISRAELAKELLVIALEMADQQLA